MYPKVQPLDGQENMSAECNSMEHEYFRQMREREARSICTFGYSLRKQRKSSDSCESEVDG